MTDLIEPTGEQAPTGKRAPRDARDQAWAMPFTSAGELVSFGLQVLRDCPAAVRLFPSEVLRQAGLLIRSNALVILFVLFMLGALLGITGTFLFEGIGLESYVAAIPGAVIMRGVMEMVFGWVLAAKYGCGIVAELGAMRISEEIDAMDVMGVRSIPYLVSSRVVAAAGVLPVLFLIGLLVHFVASKLFFVDMLGTVSPGGFWDVLFEMHSPSDLAIAVLWASLTGVVVTLVSCYYGYHAQGGPVGVGRATAQSMLVNLVLISLIGMILAQLFYGNVLDQAFGT